MINNYLRLLAAMVLSTFVLPQQAFAFTVSTCTYDGSTNIPAMETNRNPDVYFGATIPSGSSQFTALTQALSAVNRVPANISFRGVIFGTGASDAVAPAFDAGISRFWSMEYYIYRKPDGTVDTSRRIPSMTGNFLNEFYFSNDPTMDNAHTTTSYVNCVLVDKDVIFNTTPYSVDANGNRMPMSWTYSDSASSSLAYEGASRPFKPTAIHETLHYLGLGHEQDIYNIMGTDFTHVGINGSTTIPYVGEDAASGLVSIYGTTPYTAKQDLGISHWYRWNQTSGAPSGEENYSRHTRTRIYDTSNNLITDCVKTDNSACKFNEYEKDQFFKVSKGQTIRPQFIIENNGLWNVQAPVYYYLSTDNVITTADTLLKTVNRTISRDAPDLVYESVTLPSTLVSGQKYYIGAIVDPNNSFTELLETNNSAYIGIHVK